MADVYAVFGTLLALGIAFPGMLTAAWLLFPETVARAQTRLEHTPGRCLAMGVGGAAALAVPLGILFALPFGPTRFLGAVGLMLALAAATLGAAGLAAEMGRRLNERAEGRFTPAGAFLRGAVALELAAAFPFIGWFLVIPVTLLTSLGAALFALLRWRPRQAALAAEPAGA